MYNLNFIFSYSNIEINKECILQNSALEKYNIGKINFEQIFTGPVPEFPSSKRLIKNSLSPANSKTLTKPGSATKSVMKPSPDKKGKQQSMDKFVKKTNVKDKAESKSYEYFLSSQQSIRSWLSIML